MKASAAAVNWGMTFLQCGHPARHGEGQGGAETRGLHNLGLSRSPTWCHPIVRAHALYLPHKFSLAAHFICSWGMAGSIRCTPAGCCGLVLQVPSIGTALGKSLNQGRSLGLEKEDRCTAFHDRREGLLEATTLLEIPAASIHISSVSILTTDPG